MSKTTIEWSEFTWSPLRVRVREDASEIARAKGYTSLAWIATKMAGRVGQHCEHVSDGCKNCYSGTWQVRCFKHNGTGLPFDRRSRDLIEPFADENILYQPLQWKKPRRIFVENQSDLFGEWYSFEYILAVYFVMLGAPQHTYQALTKRIERAREFYLWWDKLAPGHAWPKHLHLGVSAEDQKTAEARIPVLLGIPYVEAYWASYEPALGPVEFRDIQVPGWNSIDVLRGGIYHPLFGFIRQDMRKLDWIVIGGESGPGARPFNIAWARNTIAQCKEAGVACFVKQLGAKPYYEIDTDEDPDFELPDGTLCRWLKLKDRKGGDMGEWPEDVRVREYPQRRPRALEAEGECGGLGA